MDVKVSGLSLLHEPDEIIEIRSIDPKPVISGYFRADSPAIAKELSRYPNRTFYQTMNRVKSACYAREQHERLIERPHETTTDSDIAGYQWLLIDADPVRPSGVSASREEKEAARRVAGHDDEKLMAMGFSRAHRRRQWQRLSSALSYSRKPERKAGTGRFPGRPRYVVQHGAGQD